MSIDLPATGGISPELAETVGAVWTAEAAAAGVDLTGFDPNGPLEARLSWAASKGLAVATVLARFSTKLQQSTADQVRECVLFAARKRLYVPPEFICADEGVSGRKRRRDGLDRVLLIVRAKHATTVLVYKLSRLFRAAYEGYKLFQEELVEEGLRGISVSQSIDTADEKTWEQLTVLHGLSDKMLLAAIADHVRSNLSGLFQQGYVTGALPVGFRRREVPGGRPTKRDRPRTVPEVDPEVADLIRKHYEWCKDGLAVREGWRRWVRAGGPCDPRSTTKRMSYPAYRRMLSNPRYTGVFAFGRKRNLWSSKRDYNRQVAGPEHEVVIVKSEELRIVSDELFHEVQAVLARRKLGPRGPKARKSANEVRLSDLVTDCFVCGVCTAAAGGKDVRFYVAGANAKGMRCKHGGLCPTPVLLDRSRAVKAVCDALAAAIAADTEFVADVIGRAVALDANGDESARAELIAIEKRVAACERKIEDLSDLAGEGSEDDRRAFKAKVRAAQAERATLQAQQASLQRQFSGPAEPITPEGVRALLADLVKLLDEAASGRLGDDVAFKAAAAFRQLVGGRIVVHAEPRPGRKRADVRAAFTTDVLAMTRDAVGIPNSDGFGVPKPNAAVTLWLRRPACDLLAERAAMLVDRDGLSFAEAASALTAEGYKVTAQRIWQLRKRHYEMIGEPVPARPYNNGQPRRRATDEAA